MSINSVLEKISKINESTELASHKVDLGLVEDIATATNAAKQIADTLNAAVTKADDIQVQLSKLQTEFNTQVANVKKLYPQAEKFQTNEDKIWDKAKTAADNLGLKREDIKGWADFQKNGLSVNSAINMANKYMA